MPCFVFLYFSIEEECAVSSCTSTLESKNWDLHKSLKHLNKIFNKLESYVSLLASQSKICSAIGYIYVLSREPKFVYFSIL